MSETLESDDITRDQSDALIQSVALAMKSFAVTPELLDDRLNKLRRKWKQDIGEVTERLKERNENANRRFDDTEQRLDEIPKLRDAIDDLRNSMQELHRSVLFCFRGFMLVTFAGLMGILGIVLVS